MAKAISSASTTKTKSPRPIAMPSQVEYEAWVRAINKDVKERADGQPIFTTGVKLFDLYLKNLPADNRQYHTCNTCRHFIDRFGSLVVIDETGHTTPLMWDESLCPAYYKKAVQAMAAELKGIKVTGVFLADDLHWGTPHTGDWSHFGVIMPRSHQHKHVLHTAGQSMAVVRENVGNVERALNDYALITMNKVKALLKTENLYRGEKIEGPLNWLIDLKELLSGVRVGYCKHNLLWRAVAQAPEGFCHIRASVLGTLMEEIQNNTPVDVAIKKFKAMMDPLQYQRPQAPPKAGAIDRAEKIFEALDLAPALRRRHAVPEDIQEFIWQYRPAKEAPAKDGVFAHLRNPQPVERNKVTTSGSQNITWVKFRDTILPSATELDVMIPGASGSFCGLVAAASSEAPPVLQWDDPKHRNTVSWYFYAGVTHATHWSLDARRWARVWGITPTPDQWGGRESHHGNKVVILIEGAKDTRRASLGLFPECLRSELHEVRSVIEAHCRHSTQEEVEGPAAAGLGFSKGENIGIELRVTLPHGVFHYQLDRWD